MRKSSPGKPSPSEPEQKPSEMVAQASSSQLDGLDHDMRGNVSMEEALDMADASPTTRQ